MRAYTTSDMPHQKGQLIFPNPSRSFNEKQGRITFWGYDSAIEIIVHLDNKAIRLMAPDGAQDENTILALFDVNRQRIEQAAATAYLHRPQRSLHLSVGDFASRGS